jgi:hypothetical protein
MVLRTILLHSGTVLRKPGEFSGREEQVSGHQVRSPEARNYSKSKIFPAELKLMLRDDLSVQLHIHY